MAFNFFAKFIGTAFSRQVRAAHGESLGLNYFDAGGIRFTAICELNGKYYEVVMLYARRMRTGLFEIAAVPSELFSPNKRRGIIVFTGQLDHVPRNGERVDAWIPISTRAQDEESYNTALRFLLDNHLKGHVRSFAKCGWL